MKRHLNTLYVMTQGAYLSKQGETVRVRVDDETRLRLPIHNLGSIVCFGNVLCSPFLLGLCSERGVAVTFLSERGRFLARVTGPTRGYVLLRREQYRRTDDEAGAAEVARSIVIAKISNCRGVLGRAARESDVPTARDELQGARQLLEQSLHELRRSHDLATLRGIEGRAGQIYFGAFDHLIRQQKDGFFFHRRSRRPPLDAMNALLSFLYTLLRRDLEAACESVGLDPQVGFLHRERPGRPSLALDLMEELRPLLADRVALSLVNRRQIQPSGFRVTESGGVEMTEETRKIVLLQYQTRKQDEVTHPFIEEKTTYGLVPHLQALLLARRLRGDLDAYPPFLAP